MAYNVLIVDDSPAMRRFVRRVLELTGIELGRCLEANNGLEAIRVAGDHPEIAIVLLDLTMPVMGGEEAIDRILALRPGVKVIVSTGYGYREAAARFGRKNVAGFLQKPYTSKQLAEKIAAAMAAQTD